MRCIDGIDDIDIVEDAARFVQVAQEVYKALGAPSRSGQFGAFSSERTEWMDHKDPVGHRASHSAPLFFFILLEQLFPVCCIQDPPLFGLFTGH